MFSKPLVLEILQTLCAEINATVGYEKEFGYAGYIQFEDGRKSMFRGTTFDVNGQGGSIIARDKYYCSYFLREQGFNTPEEVLIFSPRYTDQIRLKNETVANKLSGMSTALKFAAEHGFPLYVKPNDGAEGIGVFRVSSSSQLNEALQELFEENDKVLVQRPIAGRDYRVVVFDNEIVSAYERIPLRVVGDGGSSVDTLIKLRLDEIRGKGKGNKIDPNDSRIDIRLSESEVQRTDILEKGTIINLLSNSNLSSGGEAVDISDKIAPSVAETAIAATKGLGLTLAGVDILSEDALVDNQHCTILEVNSAPALHNFAGTGPKQYARVVDLYRRIVHHLNESTDNGKAGPLR